MLNLILKVPLIGRFFLIHINYSKKLKIFIHKTAKNSKFL